MHKKDLFWTDLHPLRSENARWDKRHNFWSVLGLPVSVWQIGHAHQSQERHLCLDEEPFNGKALAEFQIEGNLKAAEARQKHKLKPQRLSDRLKGKTAVNNYDFLQYSVFLHMDGVFSVGEHHL